MTEQEIKTMGIIFKIIIILIITGTIFILIKDCYKKLKDKEKFKNKHYKKIKKNKPLNPIIKKVLPNNKKIKKSYSSKPLMTECEVYFYKIIHKHYNEKYLVMPQVPLISIINKQKQYEWEYQNELFRTIDFGLINRTTLKCDLLIEINDKTHETSKRRDRDKKVQQICKIAGIPIVTFWTSQPNNQQYILKKINENIGGNDEKEDT